MDVPAEPLENLLASLRQQTRPLPPMAGLPALDRGEVIEIQGPASSGKTHLLYHVLLAALVPVSPVAAVVYDTDAAFDIQRFRHLLLSRARRLPDPDQTVRRALARVHVFRPSSLAHLAASIAGLPAYHATHMPNQEIAVLAIDSISSFYWNDRLSAEQLRNIPSPVPMASPLHHVLDAVQRVRRSHRPLVLLTNWALNPAPSRPESLYKQHLHPFSVIPSEDDISPLGAKAPGSIDRSPSPLRLAHHIALSFPPSDPVPTAPLDARHRDIGDGQISCVCRSSAARSSALRFILEITHDDVLVRPQADSVV